jgi:hypothetical protein
MVLKTIYLIRTPDFPLVDFQFIMKYLNDCKGQIVFKDGSPKEEIYIPQSSYFSRWHKNFHFVGYPWSVFFEQIENYRNLYEINPDDYVCLITNLPNVIKWFGAIDHQNSNNFFIDADRIKKYVPNAANEAIVYQIAASILRNQMGMDSKKFKKFAHEKSEGCVNDLCLNKHDFKLKLQSAKICPICAEKIAELAVNNLILGHIEAIFKKVQNSVCGANHVKNLYQLSNLSIATDFHFMLPKYDIEIKLVPQEKALYILLLNHSPEGLYCANIQNHTEELGAIYSLILGKDEISCMDKVVKNPDKLAPMMCKIRKTFLDAIGNLPKHIYDQYLISREGKRKIHLPESYIELPPSLIALRNKFRKK